MTPNDTQRHFRARIWADRGARTVPCNLSELCHSSTCMMTFRSHAIETQLSTRSARALGLTQIARSRWLPRCRAAGDPDRCAKYPGKRASNGPNAGTPSGNPLGKNPEDVWDIPNVKGRHVEKTSLPPSPTKSANPGFKHRTSSAAMIRRSRYGTSLGEAAGRRGPAWPGEPADACNRSYFAPRVEYFASAGYRTLSVDLRGHGESDKPEGPYSIRTFLHEKIRRSAMRPSMALFARARLPERRSRVR